MASIENVKIKDKQDFSLQIIYAAGLPDSIHGFVFSTSPGEYHIFLNAADNKRQQEESFLHECLHIFHGDLEREDRTTDQIETLRHKELETILSNLA